MSKLNSQPSVEEPQFTSEEYMLICCQVNEPEEDIRDWVFVQYVE